MRRAALAAAALLAGCALQPPPTQPQLQAQALPHTAVPARFAAGAVAPQPVADRWLSTFGDPALTALVSEAIAHNADLQAAAARVEQAGGFVKVASAALLPSISLAGLWSGKASSGSSGLNGVFLNLQLELDVWGRLRYGEAAAQAQAEAVAADYAYARQSLAAMIAKAWFIAIEAGLQRAVLTEMLASAEQLQQLALQRERIGPGNELAVAEARADVAGLRDALRQAELARQNALRAIELLAGRYPSAEASVAASFGALPPPVPAGLPSQLLERRPDVVAAERRVAVAFDRVGEAKAARLPRIALTAGGSSISSDLFVLQDRNNPAWGFGANLLAPLYQGGALRAQVEIRSAEQQAAIAAYAAVGQRAFGEAENALAAEFALADRAEALAAQVRASARALELAQVQYRVGSIDLRTVQSKQMALYSARSAQLRVQAEQRAQRINLHLALGGSFDDAPALAAR